MSVCICIKFSFLAKKKKNKTENETVSELRELFECNLFLIIIIDMKKNS